MKFRQDFNAEGKITLNGFEFLDYYMIVSVVGINITYSVTNNDGTYNLYQYKDENHMSTEDEIRDNISKAFKILFNEHANGIIDDSKILTMKSSSNITISDCDINTITKEECKYKCTKQTVTEYYNNTETNGTINISNVVTTYGDDKYELIDIVDIIN